MVQIFILLIDQYIFIVHLHYHKPYYNELLDTSN